VQKFIVYVRIHILDNPT